jgi:hypothetical protein
LTKKVLVGFAASLLLGVAFLAYLAAPYFATPKFTVLNGSDKPVQVVACWREETKNLGTIAPGQKVEFVVSAEAAMSFKARFANGKELASEEIYFTSGTAVAADISESDIKLQYVSST